ncbi:MAG: 2'-deoxycytidine 5'-triphosphate deaminase [Planctomycetota bacterium]|jgi:dCTP deaminase|nr:2'-deoxycytidine 5'-triphosphate deaminase [Planctomycetota bacterium]
MNRGTLPYTELEQLVTSGAISSEAGLDSSQLQPSSVDLTLAAEAYRMPGSVLPLPGETVRDLIAGLALDQVDLSQPTCLARGQVYLIRLREQMRLEPGVEAYTNSKSSTGRVDLATRVLADGSPRYDRIPAGYTGELWLELIPRSFDIVASAGDSLNQAIIFRNRSVLNQAELRALHDAEGLLFDSKGDRIPAERSLFDGRVVMTANLSTDIVGYVAKRSHRPVVLANIGQHKSDDFFTPLTRPSSGYLYLQKDSFYILATHEGVRVPADYACEMVPYDATAGEFRAHYAGFFDPGWGVRPAGEPQGARAVLEVRPHEDDLILRHGQPICAMAYERLSSNCARLYGSTGNNYANQDGPRLSKHFA